MARFTNKVVLITGGTSGIGRETAVAFAKEGAKVVVAGRRRAEGEETVRLVQSAGGEGLFVLADVSQESDVERLIADTVTKFGKLDAVFNNAGVEGTVGPVHEQTAENYQHTFSINVLGVLLTMKHAIRQFLKQKNGGSIVNTTSIGGHAGMPGASVYAASKHAVVGLTRSAALEYASARIRVNAVAPGGVQTDMLDRFTNGRDSDGRKHLAAAHPFGRIGTVDEISAAVLFLSSDEASFITGHDLVIDGGYLAK